MASRASVRHHFWRDMRLVYVLLAWVALAIALFLYFDKSITFRDAAPAKPVARAAADDALYTGSIIVVPRAGNDCWKMMLDNRTGRMWENGYVDCNTVVGVLAESKKDGASRAGRLHAIGASFRDGN